MPLIALCVCVAMGTVYAAAAAQGRPARTVLSIHWGPEEFPGTWDIDAAIRGVLSSIDPPVNYYAEYLESETFPAEEASLALRDYIRRKFEDHPIDVVIANTTPALRFALLHRAELFPGAPVVFTAGPLAREVLDRPPPGLTGIVTDTTFEQTLTLALKLQPDVKRVFVIARAPTTEGYGERLRAALEPFARRVELTFLEESSLDRLLASVKVIPPQSVILYTRYVPEIGGRNMYSVEVARRISEVSPVPMYGTTDLYMGTGVMGGVMRQSDATGIRVGQMVAQILQGTPPEAIPIERVRGVPMFDWRQVLRWGIETSRIPPDADIRFRVPTLWESHRWLIIGTAIVVIGQLVLIAALLAQRSRRHRAERAMQQSEATLRTSYQRIRQLAGRLINAQEAARAGIAQDLHDDVCQRLVYVSMAVNGLMSTTGDLQDDRTQSALAELERDTQAVFDGLRRLSHELHPTTLRLLGLAPALKAHCVEVERRHGVHVTFEANGDLGQVHADLAVCFFRIAQESLRNAIGHGGAHRCSVALARVGDAVQLTVSDDGCGFDVDQVRGGAGGLGLVTMEERVHAIGGAVRIDTQPGRGTTIHVLAPLRLPPMPPATDPAVRRDRRASVGGSAAVG